MKNTPATITIFGYGSLMSDASLLETAPTAKNIRPAYIKGFHRTFNKTDDEGWTSECLNAAGENIQGIPYCAVNIMPNQPGDVVNGVVFEIDPAGLRALKRREAGYDLIETEFFDLENNQTLGTCQVFSARDCSGMYEEGNLAQDYYLNLCLEAAKEYGEAFYEQFLASTYVNGQPLSSTPRLLQLEHARPTRMTAAKKAGYQPVPA